MILFKYISFHYLKYFFIILLSLNFFMVGFDYLGRADKLPDSANLVFLYLMFQSFLGIHILLPPALVFAMIGTKIFLIRSNALVAFYSIGYTKRDILKPFIVIANIIVVIYITLHMTILAKAEEYALNIYERSSVSVPSNNLFFTYEGKFVYIETLFPLLKKAENIKVFKIEQNSLVEVLVAKEANYHDNYWYIKNADIIQKPKELGIDSKGISVQENKEVRVLKNFKPKILDQVHEGKVNYTILEAIDTYLLLRDQNINMDTIKASLFKNFFYPYFVPALVVIIFFFVPISSRSLNITLFSFLAILSTLLTWGLLYMASELALHKSISAEVGILLPIVLLNIMAIFIYSRRKNSH